jgi:hypothetical protein
MVDLSTTYLGLKLKNPLVASASPLSQKVDTAKKLKAWSWIISSFTAQNLLLKLTLFIHKAVLTLSKQIPMWKRSRKSSRRSISLSLAA